MKRRYLLTWSLVTTLCVVSEVDAGTRRALLVGINEYRAATPTNPGRRWTNLEGAVNDVKAMRELLVARFDFIAENVLVLTDEQATRDAILRSLREHLVEPAADGDVCVFYYAGHGSQVVNSLSPEPDGKDETIVPADANAGQPDIRDKELERVFNDILDRGAVLTIFFDSCYSTSLQRGLGNDARFRSLGADTSDVADPRVDPRGKPEERGALVFAAAQEFERAQEMTFEGLTHGAFSYALAKKLRQMPRDEPTEQVFASIKAHMNSMGLWQQAILQGSPERMSMSLFGETERGGHARAIVALRSVSHGVCELEGGRAAGIHPRCVLKRIEPESGTEDGQSVRLRVESVQGLALSRARVIDGDPAALEPGDSFEVERWAHPDHAFLRVWLPEQLPTHEEMDTLARKVAALGVLPNMRWIADPTQETPTHTLRWSHASWELRTASRLQDMGRHPSAEDLRSSLADSSVDEVHLFLQLPPSRELQLALRLSAPDADSAIEVTLRESDAHYLLVGRYEDGQLQYAWVLPGMTEEMADTSSVLPVRSDWTHWKREDDSASPSARRLRGDVFRLMTIRAWYEMEGPPDDGVFPYRLAIVNHDTGQLDTRPVFFDGDSFRIALMADEDALRYGVQGRYVYVLALDSDGTSKLLFPPDRRNAANYFPRRGTDTAPPSTIHLPTRLVVQKPHGIDTFVLLTTREMLPNPGVLEARGVRHRSPSARDPLSKLLASIAGGRRGIGTATHVDWSIQRLSVRTAPIDR